MAERKLSEIKTSELLDMAHEEDKKENDDALAPIREELQSREPFSGTEYILNDNTEGLVKKVESLEKEVEELRKKFRDHDHKDGNVVVKVMPQWKLL